MGLTFRLTSPRHMLAKLHRGHKRLQAEVHEDHLFNFVVTAYHIIDWIKKNESVPPEVRNDVQRMYEVLPIAVCRDLANASKHFALWPDDKKRVTAKTSAISDYGEGRYGAGAYGVGEPTVVVVLTDGSRFNALDLATAVVNAWEAFFDAHKL